MNISYLYWLCHVPWHSTCILSGLYSICEPKTIKFQCNCLLSWCLALNLRRHAPNKSIIASEVGYYSIVTFSYIIVSHFWLAVFEPIISVASSTIDLILSVTVSCRILFFKLMLDFSLGKVVLDPPKTRWVTQIFLGFFLWWMMIWSPRIVSYLSKKTPVVYHYFDKNIETTFCLCEMVCGRRGLSRLHRGGRTFGGLGLQVHIQW